MPTPVIVEAWRGGKRSARVAALLEACVIEPLFPDLARIAGEAIASVKGATMVDAVVMASAARRGDRVLTADFAALDRLCSHFSRSPSAPGLALPVLLKKPTDVGFLTVARPSRRI